MFRFVDVAAHDSRIRILIETDASDPESLQMICLLKKILDAAQVARAKLKSFRFQQAADARRPALQAASKEQRARVTRPLSFDSRTASGASSEPAKAPHRPGTQRHLRWNGRLDPARAGGRATIQGGPDTRTGKRGPLRPENRPDARAPLFHRFPSQAKRSRSSYNRRSRLRGAERGGFFDFAQPGRHGGGRMTAFAVRGNPNFT